ncbi:MAG: sulfatase-like hydrolase/transferase [Rhodopirellula sp. JB055]|uniref:sulfatase-like hydrolase/transferase n=1 Tax=Rhodopirellula sp. JB055 TaxID=3342846 RepID=UPI00370B3AE7
MHPRSRLVFVCLFLLSVCSIPTTVHSEFDAGELRSSARPNILFVLTDDHRADCLSDTKDGLINTPNLQRICEQGTRFENAFAVLAICSPSRAACLTGQYGSINGVTSIGNVSLRSPASTFASKLRGSGYLTAVTGKWHLKTTPEEAGFQFASVCHSNGTWYDRRFKVDGESKKMPGFVDDVTADESIRFIRQAKQQQKPFIMWMNTQVPHMDHRHTWPAEETILAKYETEKMPLPTTWDDDLEGKPAYLKTSRNRIQAEKYGYQDPNKIRSHTRDYYASVEQMDRAVGRVFDELERLEIRENTWVILMGDNGWFLGEHGMTSKVLAYEESMRIPMAIFGPGVKQQVAREMVLNVDVAATILDIAGVASGDEQQGRSLLPIARGETVTDWRTSFLYEAPTPQLGSQPHWAIRDQTRKLIRTETKEGKVWEELYDLQKDPIEQFNLVSAPKYRDVLEDLRTQLKRQRSNMEASANRWNATLVSKPSTQQDGGSATVEAPKPIRTDLFISGVYPHLTTYGIYSQNGAHLKTGHNECGIGAIVPWAGKLWMVNYAPHMPRGSEHKLFSVDPDLTKPLNVHPESVGGTPAGRMIHEESQQLLIGHHLIDAKGNVRTISPSDMPMRVTAITRHLKDPENMVYYIDMEGAIWEANVHSLKVNRLFKKPVPGWHGKGGYTSQGRLVISNNGELHVGSYKDVLVGGEAKTEEERGVLAEWDGERWKIVERRQYTEVTGPNGITGGSDGDDPIWTMGWDRRTVRLKVLEDGKWHTYLLPKAAYCNDASHGWYTEWPRIREITGGRWMMDMHGMFFDFPKGFSVGNSKGLRPIGSHLRYVPDFCAWNDQLVLATDETSIQGNPLAGQPQSNLWFGDYQDLKTWGPASAYGGPWIDDEVKANEWSDPFLVDGFQSRTLYLAIGQLKTKPVVTLRATDQQEITSLPEELSAFPTVTVRRGDWTRPAPGYAFQVDQPVTVYLAVDHRGDPPMSSDWQLTQMEVRWGNGHHDRVYMRAFPAGKISIPANETEHTPGSFGMPHTAFVDGNAAVKMIRGEGATLNKSQASRQSKNIVVPADASVQITMQIDPDGTNEWIDFRQFSVTGENSVVEMLPREMDAVWVRFKTDRDCMATAFMHQTSAYPNQQRHEELFAGLAGVDESQAIHALVYPAKRSRDLRLLTDDGRAFDFTKSDFQFVSDEFDSELAEKLQVEPEFTVDEASVIVRYQGKRYRLPKGDAIYDKPFESGWPRALREVESERTIANIHGTFYEVPLVVNGAPPAWNLIRPIASHRKQISDFCSWNGLLVLAGVKSVVKEDGHVFRHADSGMGLWFGGVDDLWKFGKPVGQGGPWKDSPVQAGIPSDAYLMRGYDQKSVTLSHEHSQPVGFTLEVDLDGEGRWVAAKRLVVPSGSSVRYKFPEGFSACWVRAISDADTTATVQLGYQ